MPLSEPVDGFRLGYERAGSGPPAVLLHGWPGDRSDYRVLAPALAGACEVIVPDPAGAEGPGETGKETGPGTHDVPPAGE